MEIRPDRIHFVMSAAALFLLQATGPAPASETSCKDAAITRIVQARLSADREIGQFRIDVTTTECVVTLRGCVESRDQAKKAKVLAKRLVQVKVRNELTVCTLAPRKPAARPKKS